MHPARELTDAVEGLRPGRALDLACGTGRHAFWLAERGWRVAAVDITPVSLSNVAFVAADLEHGGFAIERGVWDLIVCWLYWQPDLLPEIRAGVRMGGVVAIAGKTSGRFATSLAQMRDAFSGWREISSGENEVRAFLIAEKAVD